MDKIVIDKTMNKEIGPIAYCDRELIGSGGFGWVYRGTFRGEKGNPLPVAVKRIFNGHLNGEVREVNALKELKDHPNIIYLHGTENDENFYYFALELCAASMDDVFLPDDSSRKYKGPLPSDLDVLLQLSEGLHFIHRNGFVHRDVKPDNVLISFPKEDGTVVMKWADFGFCKPTSSRGTFSVSDVRGTINWIAPEILATLGLSETIIKPRGTVESDTWSFGCVVFAYLTKGKHPFGDSDITRNILDANSINLSALPDDHFAANIIKEMIQKETKERIKLVNVVKILNEVKAEELRQQEQDDNVRGELEVGQLYSWEQWNLVLKNDELFIWSEDVGIEGFPLFYNETARINLNDTDKMKVVSIHPSGWSEVQEETAGRKGGELNKEMFQMLGIPLGTPSKSPLNRFFLSHGRKWTVCPSGLGDTLIIKGDTLLIIGEELRGFRKWEMILFGLSLYSVVHIITEGDGKPKVYMTENKAKLVMENELLDLCSRLNLKPKEFDRIAALLQAGIDPNCTNTNGQTPLLLSLAKQGGETRLQCLKILLESNQSRYDKGAPKKVDLNVHDRQQRNAFELLLLTRNTADNDPMVYETLKLLVHSGIDINLTDDQYRRTALHHLCENYKNENIVDAMELLIQKGVDVNLKDKDGRTALHSLCEFYKRENIVDAMELLIEKGIDATFKDKSGRTALHLLCSHYKNENMTEAANVLIEKGVDVNSKDGRGRSVLYYLCTNRKNDNIVAVVNLLIEKGLDYKFQDHDGFTALHYLCVNYITNENNVKIMKLLLDKGVGIDLKDQGGRTALYYLCRQRDQYENIFDAMKLLIDNGVDVNATDNWGRTALNWFCENYRNDNIVDVMKLFIENGAVVNLKDDVGRTALHYFCENNKNENIVAAIMELLVEKGVDIHVEDRGGKTALDYLGIRDPKVTVWKEKFLR